MKSTIKFSSIHDGQYDVEMNLNALMDDENLARFNALIADQAATLKNGILRYKSETILPESEDKKCNILFVFGNPAIHSIENGMFFFSRQDGSRHSMWGKLAKAGVVKEFKSNINRSIDARRKEAQNRKQWLLNGTTSKDYLIGMTTFYSFPTSAVDGVKTVEQLFDPIIDKLRRREVERVLKYEFTRGAKLIFVQKSSYEAFKTIAKDAVKDILFWPIRGKGASGENLKNLLNQGVFTSDEENITEQADITEPSILFRIGRLYRNDLSPIELYDITRGRWRLSKRREKAKLGFAVYNNRIIEVYKIIRWFRAGTTFSTRTDQIPKNRWEFIGNIASKKCREKYIGKSVAQYFKPGNRNPVRYVGAKNSMSRMLTGFGKLLS